MNRVEYLFTKLMEEAAEVQQDAAKCMLFGADETYAPIGISNAHRVRVEFNEMLAVIEMLQDEGAMPRQMVDKDIIAAKKLKVEKYMLYSAEIGCLK